MSEPCYEVRKLGYSRSPWRVIDAAAPKDWRGRDKEVWYEDTFDHPESGLIVIPTPMAYDTKHDASAAAQALNEGRLPELLPGNP